MKLRFIIIAIALLGTNPHAWAQDKGFGAGVMFGTQNGISMKLWTGDVTAIQGGMSWYANNGGYFNVHADALIHKFDLIQVRDGELSVYFGLGAKLGINNDIHVGIRVPFGLVYLFRDAPVDIFVEVAPGFALLPATAFDLDGGLGARYYF